MTKTILVVEDDKSVARMLQDVLEAEGFAVLSERDGEWGLRAFQEKSVDLLIIDVLVPKIKGFDLISRLRETDKGRMVPIVVISGVYRAAMHRERIMAKHRVVEYLDKPVDLDRLIDVLHDVFSSAYPVASSAPKIDPSLAPAPAASSAPRPPPPPPPPSGVMEAPLDLPDRGELEEIPFARLLGALFSARASGTLLLRKASVKKIVYLRRGIPVFVKSNLLNECLGRIMVAERLITQEECDRSLEKKKTVHKKQGEILVEMGSISPHNLEFALELQMQLKLFEVFSWLDGKYQFIAKDEYQGPQVALSLAPTAMIYEGASRTMSSERIGRELSRIEHAVIATSRDPTFRYQALELDPRASGLIDRIDGKRTLRELLDETDFDEDDAALLLYALSCTSLLKIATPGSVPAAPEPEKPITQTMVLNDSDVVALSTAEINAIAALTKAEAERALSSPPAPVPAPAPAVAAVATPAVAAPSRQRFDAHLFDEVEPSISTVPAEAPRVDADSRVASTASEILARVDSIEAALSFPRSESDINTEVPPPPSTRPQSPASSSGPALSDEIRRQVRARLEAEASRLAAERASNRPITGPGSSAPAPTPSSGPRKVPSRPKEPLSRVQAPRLDLERDNARAKKELVERLERMQKQTHYEVLGVHRRASVEEMRAQHQKLARENHPDRIVPGTSRENRALAETIYIHIGRAFEALSDVELRREYDRALNEAQPDDRIAPMLLAERAFARGKAAFDANNLDAAYEAFKEAADLNANEGAYWAYLAFTAFSRAPKDDKVRELALAQLDRALELSPRSEEIFVFRGTVHQKIGNRADAVREFEAAVRVNADCVGALRALRTLEPPAARKTGLLSRLTIGSDRNS